MEESKKWSSQVPFGLLMLFISIIAWRVEIEIRYQLFSCMVIRCTCNPALYWQPGATFELNIELLEVVQPEKGGA